MSSRILARYNLSIDNLLGISAERRVEVFVQFLNLYFLRKCGCGNVPLVFWR
jgi:hypothetical protein